MRKRKGRKASATEFNNPLSSMNNNKTICVMERKQMVNKIENDRCELLHLKKKKIEMKIMEIRFYWHECNATRVF